MLVSAWAQESQAEVGAGNAVGAAESMAAVTVIGSAQAVLDLAGSGAYIDQSVIDAQSYINPNRVLSRVPGVYLREEDGYGNFPNISLRGADPSRSSKVTLMEDGIMTAPAPYSAPAAYYFPKIARMNAVEVLKGSSQVRFGPHTTGGVINFVSTPVPEDFSGRLKMTYGSDNTWFGHTWAGDTLETSAGKFGWLLEFHGQGSDGFRDIETAPGFQNPGNTGFELYEPMLKLSWEPNSGRRERWEFKAGYTQFNADETYLGLSEFDANNNPHRRYAATRFDNIESAQFRTYLKYDVALSDDLDVQTSVYYNNFERDWFKLDRIQRPVGTNVNLSKALMNPADLAILRGQAPGTLVNRHNDREYWAGGLQTQADYRFSTGALAHTVTAGLRMHHDNSSRDQYDVFFRQDGRGAIVGQRNGAAHTAGWREEDATAVAVFIEDEIAFGNFTVKPGVRYEHINYGYTDFLSGMTDNGTLDVWTPGIGATWSPNDAVTVFGGVYQGISVPEPIAYLRDGVEEETSIGYELGLRWQNSEKALGVELAGFFTDFDNLLVLNNVGGTGTGKTENVGETEVAGLELAVSWDPAQAWDAGFRAPLYVSTTWTQAKLVGDSSSTDLESIFSGGKDGNDVPYIPEWQLSAGIGLEFEKWGCNLDATYATGTYTTADNLEVPVNDARQGRTEDAFVLDFSVHYKVREGLKILAGVSNLLDGDAVTSRQPHGPRSGAARAYFAGFEYAF